jgi:hypothetical protein
MRTILSFLEKYKLFTPPDISLRKTVVEIIRDITGISLSVKNISVRNKIVYISASPLYKSEIFIKKEKIIDLLKEKVPQSVVEDMH